MVVCAVDVGCYTLEHFWSETCKDGDQFDMEPTNKLLLSEARERWTNDHVGPVHYAIPHVNLELWDLQK